MKKCLVCGKEFNKPRSNRFYCSNACRRYAYRVRQDTQGELTRQVINLRANAQRVEACFSLNGEKVELLKVIDETLLEAV